MHDKPLDTELERARLPEGKGLLDAAFDPGNAACEQVKAIRPDSRSNQALENSGTLPRIELLDPAANQGDWKVLPSDGTAIGGSKLGGTSNSESSFSELSLVESGKIVKEIPPSYYGDSKETDYDNGRVRHEFADGTTIELRPNHMTVAEDRDHDITIKLPSGEYIEPSPREGNPGVTSTEVDDNGRVTYNYKDGTHDVIDTDGTRYSIDQDGTLVKINSPDG